MSKRTVQDELVFLPLGGSGEIGMNFNAYGFGSPDDRQWIIVDCGVLFGREGHTPGVSVECARWLAEEAPVQGVGVETVGTDAGLAHSFDPPFPCHSFLLGRDKYGLTQLQNLAQLPAVGAVVIASPLPIVHGSGSPCRVLALVE